MTNIVRAFEQNPRLGVHRRNDPPDLAIGKASLVDPPAHQLADGERIGPTLLLHVSELSSGANFVIRREAYRQIEDEVRSINSELGHTGKKLLSGEDTCIAFKIQKRGWDVRYIRPFPSTTRSFPEG